MISKTTLTAMGLILGLSGCADLAALMDRPGRVLRAERPVSTFMTSRRETPTPTGTEAPSTDRSSSAIEAPAPTAAPVPVVERGTGQFAGAPSPRSIATAKPAEQVSLAFEDMPLDEVVRAILGDALDANYVIDPSVSGSVTLETDIADNEQALLHLLERILAMHKATLVDDGDLYRILPAGAAVRSVPSQGGADLAAGEVVRVVPLRHVSASRMAKLLDPFTEDKNRVRADDDRNLVILSGPSGEVGRLMETLRIFDVDWLAGRSVALYPLTHVGAKGLVPELQTVFGGEGGPLAGMLRFEPITRLNAILVVANQPHHLDRAAEWIHRLDKGSRAGRDLFVHPLENGKATEMASILSEVFAAEKGGAGSNGGVSLASATDGPDPTSLPIRTSDDIRIIADEGNNALLVLASAEDYKMVEAAINKLDRVPVQVLVEATIAEVTLTNELRYGVQWYFTHGTGLKGTRGNGIFSTGTSSTLASTFPGFSYVLSNAMGQTRMVVDALDDVTDVDIISSPHLMIRNNQTAELQVGDEVPVTIQQQQSTSGEANLVNTIQYRNTGVILRVTPRVNANGSISMDVEQEMSTVPSTSASSLTPTISQRRIKSSIVIQSGETVVLGGLISDEETQAKSGVPVLSDLPLVGSLFGSNSHALDRTELLIFIHPRVVRDPGEARRLTQEVRSRVNRLKELGR
ncbi:type II secretion system secretin GspD [Magnetospira sp. QH-2]|uniref:type II secretion system secretin GspD n=1 Tax=Magnetospira sp. (strain QH-2) TaxID=1288970 RepID=UPI0003E80AD6|nr:type II secretion system secretin GspD [Magnetospira sp. QH-2]CCQ73358.1 Putative general secretion pathway protein D [Magnetospira sp. QH-2]